MTNERAIELLQRISDSQFDGEYGDERREALEMAVRALSGDGDMISRQAVMKEFSDFVRKSNNSDFAPTPTWNDAVSLVGSMPSAQIATDINVGDTIYRQDAIDAIHCNIVVTGKENAELVAKTIGEFADRIKTLPSAQPQRKKGKWIDGKGNVKTVGYGAYCSCCKRESEYVTNYCPHCGARMDGGESE